jgi:L-amino acid N-acyltransferase YncA
MIGATMGDHDVGDGSCSPWEPILVENASLAGASGTLVGEAKGSSREPTLSIRAARESDLETILEIYNQAVVHTTATFDVVPRSLEAQRAWFAEHGGRYPVVVWEEDGRVLAWGSISPYGSRPAYRFAGEVSVYVEPGSRRRGLGDEILRELVALGVAGDFHTLVALITNENEGGIRLAQGAGFHRTGTLEEVGYKFDRWLDVAVYQRSCDPRPASRR